MLQWEGRGRGRRRRNRRCHRSAVMMMLLLLCTARSFSPSLLQMDPPTVEKTMDFLCAKSSSLERTWSYYDPELTIYIIMHSLFFTHVKPKFLTHLRHSLLLSTQRLIISLSRQNLPLSFHHLSLTFIYSLPSTHIHLLNIPLHGRSTSCSSYRNGHHILSW